MNKYYNSELVLDPSDQVIGQAEFERQYWTSRKFGHVSGNEDLPPNMPATRGLVFVIMPRVDVYHSGYTFTQSSRTGFLIYVNSAPVYWMSKKQTSCES